MIWVVSPVSAAEWVYAFVGVILMGAVMAYWYRGALFVEG